MLENTIFLRNEVEFLPSLDKNAKAFKYYRIIKSIKQFTSKYIENKNVLTEKTKLSLLLISQNILVGSVIINQ